MRRSGVSATTSAAELRALGRSYDTRADVAEGAGLLTAADRLRHSARECRRLAAVAALRELPSQVRAVGL